MIKTINLIRHQANSFKTVRPFLTFSSSSLPSLYLVHNQLAFPKGYNDLFTYLEKYLFFFSFPELEKHQLPSKSLISRFLAIVQNIFSFRHQMEVPDPFRPHKYCLKKAFHQHNHDCTGKCCSRFPGGFSLMSIQFH